MLIPDRSYCVENDVKRILPEISDYDRKRELTGWVVDSGNRYVNGSVGSVEALFRYGVSLGSAKASVGLVVADGDWYSENDVVYLFSAIVPKDISAGRLWSTLILEEIKIASERIDFILGNSAIVHGWLDSDYDYIIRYGCASIVVGNMVRAYDDKLADSLSKIYDNESPRGLLQKLRDGIIKISFYDPIELVRGKIVLEELDDSTTGRIDRFLGFATSNDTVKLEIVDGGDFENGVISTITYKVLGKNEDGLMLEEVVTETEINGDFQDLANGINVRFSVGKYKAGDYWHIKMSKEVKKQNINIPISAV